MSDCFPGLRSHSGNLLDPPWAYCSILIFLPKLHAVKASHYKTHHIYWTLKVGIFSHLLLSNVYPLLSMSVAMVAAQDRAEQIIRILTHSDWLLQWRQLACGTEWVFSHVLDCPFLQGQMSHCLRGDACLLKLYISNQVERCM